MDFDEGQLVCDFVSVPMGEFPDNASEASPIECHLQDCLDCTKENDKDSISFDDDFAAETFEGLCEAGDVQAITDSCTQLHLSNERIFSGTFLSLTFFSTTSSGRSLTRKHISKLTHLLHLTVLVLLHFLILTRQLSRRNSIGLFKKV